jgi:single-stranded DNA-binding protein
MLVTISGYAGRDLKTTQIPLLDSTDTSTVTDTAVRVKVAGDVADWYLVKFTDAALIKASQFITKNSLITVVGDLTFEDWIDEQQTRCSKPVVTVSDLQLLRA